MQEQLRAYGRFLILLPDKAPQYSKGGIALPDNATKTVQRGKVISRGPKITSIEVGNTVCYSQYAGTQFDHDGQSLLILNIKDVLAVVSDKPQTTRLSDRSAAKVTARVMG